MNSFYKYSATGNDFVVIDNRDGCFDLTRKDYWARVCERHFGVGADGVLALMTSEKCDYRMRYLNADGGEVSMCGNGARALLHFYQRVIARKIGRSSFETMNGVYQGEVLADGRVSVVMSEFYDENKIAIGDLYEDSLSSYYANTGVPHCVYEVKRVEEVAVAEVGAQVRYDPRFREGTNVNFYQRMSGGKLKVRTYERGVEGETLSCGTGIVATALGELARQKKKEGTLRVITRGGEVEVTIGAGGISYCGEVLAAFKGELLF